MLNLDVNLDVLWMEESAMIPNRRVKSDVPLGNYFTLVFRINAIKN